MLRYVLSGTTRCALVLLTLLEGGWQKRLPRKEAPIPSGVSSEDCGMRARPLVFLSLIPLWAVPDRRLRSPRHKCAGVLVQLPLSCFRLRDQRFPDWAVSGSPPWVERLGSHGTLPVTSKASPTANVYCANHIAVSSPSTILTDIGSIVCSIATLTCWAFLRGMSWINHLYLNAKTCSLIGDELRELRERPAILVAVVFAGRGPTTCTCRALSNSREPLYFDRSYPRLMGVI